MRSVDELSEIARRIFEEHLSKLTFAEAACVLAMLDLAIKMMATEKRLRRG